MKKKEEKKILKINKTSFFRTTSDSGDDDEASVKRAMVHSIEKIFSDKMFERKLKVNKLFLFKMISRSEQQEQIGCGEQEI